jgi:hypothetical protein
MDRVARLTEEKKQAYFKRRRRCAEKTKQLTLK